MAIVVSLRYIGVALFCLLCLGACGNRNAAEAILEDYLRHVETATGIIGEQPSLVPLMVYPARRDRALPVDEIRIGFLDYLKFYECDLFRSVSERNSVLGKIMPVSKRLAYEINFLQTAENCRQKLAKDQAIDSRFMEQFAVILQRKRQNIAPLFWNAIFDSPEMQKSFSLAVDPLDIEEVTGYADSRRVLDYFEKVGIRLRNSLPGIALEDLEDHYFTLQWHRYGGRLFKSLAQLTEFLNRVASSLEMASRNSFFCPANQPSSQALELQSIHNEYYLAKVKPYISRIHQQGRDWLEAIERLIKLPKVSIPASFREYQSRMLSLDSERGLWKAFEKAIQRHDKAWRTLLGQCGLMPGSMS